MRRHRHRHHHRLTRRISAPVGIVVVLLCLVVPAAALALTLRRSTPSSQPTSSTSTSSSGVSEIGVLYADASASKHECTASVVDSPQGDMLITAAHCVSGKGAGMVFVPDQQSGGAAPYGRWTVTALQVTPHWVSVQDPHDDVAFLTVAPKVIDGRSTEIQQVVGGARLGPSAGAGRKITVTGYPAGATNGPITCTTRTYLTNGYPSFDCGGFVDGTSGTPWLVYTSHGAEIVGVIGGLHQGGCTDATSYSSPLTQAVQTAYRIAELGAGGNVAPSAGGDGCS